MLLTKLRPEQGEAVERALGHDGFALFCEQRTGKSLMGLAVADSRKPDIVFIVCPKKALRVWREQFREHIKIDWECQKLIVHYEGVTRAAKDRRHWRKKFRAWRAEGLRVLLIVDEGHRIKGKGSIQSSMIRSLGRESKYRLLLTGTPFDKVREDAWAIMDFVEPGALEYTWDEFADEYLETKKIPTGNKNPRTPWRHFRKKIIGTRNNKRFRRIIQRYSYRVTLREAQKRSGGRGYIVRRRVVRFDLKPETRRVYNELETQLVAEVRRKRVSTPLVVTLVAKLQQLAGGYLIHVEEKYRRDGTPILTARGRPKIVRTIIPVGREKLVELTKVIKGYPRRKKLVICVNYRHEIEIIGRQLERLGRSWKRIAGGDAFDGKFDTDTIVMQIRSGEAIDLAAADTFIMYSWDYSNISHEQAKFRILKFSSTRVNYIYLMANETVDEQIYAAVRHKRNVTRLVIDRYRPRRRRREDRISTRRDQERAA